MCRSCCFYLEDNIVTRVTNTQEFLEWLREVYPTVICLSEQYINNKTPIKLYCTVCDYTWKSTSHDLHHGHGCPRCGRRLGASKRVKPHEQFVRELHDISPTILVVGSYVGNNKKIKCKCLVCGHEWNPQPSNLLQGSGCPECAKIAKNMAMTKSHQQFIDDLYAVNPNIQPLEPYVNSKTKIQFQCLIDGTIWPSAPNTVLRGHGCPTCSESRGEATIRDYLLNHGIEHHTQHRFKDCKDLRPLPFDFFIPQYNLVIEYDGKQHFEPIQFGGVSMEQAEQSFKECQEHDAIKTEYCKQHSINILRIPYTEFDHIQEKLDELFD